jgi:hypothetical protein
MMLLIMKKIPGTVHWYCIPGIIFYSSFFLLQEFRSIKKEVTNPAPPKRSVHDP